MRGHQTHALHEVPQPGRELDNAHKKGPDDATVLDLTLAIVLETR
jgi:hypothetical protein